MGNCPGGSVSEPAPLVSAPAPEPLGVPPCCAPAGATGPRKISNKGFTVAHTAEQLKELVRQHRERAAWPAQTQVGDKSEGSDETPTALGDDPPPPCHAPSPRRRAPPRRTALHVDAAPAPGAAVITEPTAGSLAAAAAAAVAAAAAAAQVEQKNQEPEMKKEGPASIPAARYGPSRGPPPAGTSEPAPQPPAAAGGHGGPAEQQGGEPADTEHPCTGCDAICDPDHAPPKSAPVPLPAPAPERAAHGEGPKTVDTGRRAVRVAPPPKISALDGAPKQPPQPESGGEHSGGPKKGEKKSDSAFTAAPKKKAAAPYTPPAAAAVPLAALTQQPSTGTATHVPVSVDKPAHPPPPTGECRPPPPERGTGPLSGAKKKNAANDSGQTPHYMRPLQREPRARAPVPAVAAALVQHTTQPVAPGHEPSPRPPASSDAAGPGARPKNAPAASSSSSSTQAGEKSESCAPRRSPSPVVAPHRSASGSSRSGPVTAVADVPTAAAAHAATVPTAPEKGPAQQPAAPAERAAAPAALAKTPAESAELPPLPSVRPQPPPERGAATASSSSKSKAHAGVPSYMRPLQRAARTRTAPSAACPTVQEGCQERSPRPRPPAPPSADPGMELPSRVAASASCGSSSRGGEAEADGGGSAPRRSPSPVAPASCLTASASRASMQTADSGHCGGGHTESRRPSTAPTGSAPSLRTVGSEDSVRHNPTPPPQGGAERPQPGGGGGVRRLDSRRGGSEERRASLPSSGSDARPRAPQGAQRPQQAVSRAPFSRRSAPVSTLVRFWRGECDGHCVCGCARISVDSMLARMGQYDWLEQKHHYIQWLFPKTNTGVAGACAPPLTEEDAAVLAADQGCESRLLRAYKMMADFWGFEEESDGNGLRRTANWAERFANLQRCDHNLLRITRVLLSLRLLKHERLAVQLVEALLDAVIDGNLPGARASLVKYWIPALCGREAERLRRRARDAGVEMQDTGSAYFRRGCRAALH